MSDFLIIALIALSTHRLTRLITRDAFPASVILRERVVNKWGDASWQAYLSECDWCASMYVSAVVTALATIFVGVPAPMLVWLSASTLTGLIAQREPE